MGNGKQEVNRIEKRAIEALAVTPIIRGLSEKIGEDEARAILREVNQQEAFQRGQSEGKGHEQDVIGALAADVASWGEGGGWEMEVLEKTPSTYSFNVLRCPYYERYKALGVEAFGVELSCCRDKPFAKGFHPQLELKRTQTIMEGADHCDFRYILNDG